MKFLAWIWISGLCLSGCSKPAPDCGQLQLQAAKVQMDLASKQAAVTKTSGNVDTSEMTRAAMGAKDDADELARIKKQAADTGCTVQ